MIIIIQTHRPVKYFLPDREICAKIKNSNYSETQNKGDHYGI